MTPRHLGHRAQGRATAQDSASHHSPRSVAGPLSLLPLILVSITVAIVSSRASSSSLMDIYRDDGDDVTSSVVLRNSSAYPTYD
ncbi:unnamed protein product [Nezara viridula]|uniref:Uncharacterized protein n=1 Tax=Nezara viridula TaxID=85310 RepID=A0A9P0MUT1_NEZVI|nr:unnamed protein product [Nezara viridula]